MSPPHDPEACRGSKCQWCFPGPGLSRVQVNVVVTIDMAAARRDFGIREDHGHWNDAKQWLEDDLSVMISKLPYLKHMFGVEVKAKGLRRK